MRKMLVLGAFLMPLPFAALPLFSVFFSPSSASGTGPIAEVVGISAAPSPLQAMISIELDRDCEGHHQAQAALAERT